jgi:hypothetical protein
LVKMQLQEDAEMHNCHLQANTQIAYRQGQKDLEQILTNIRNNRRLLRETLIMMIRLHNKTGAFPWLKEFFKKAG